MNNEPWEKGTTMQKSWLKPTCSPKRSWITMTQEFILRLTFTYVIAYFIFSSNCFSYSRLFGYRKPYWVSGMGRSHTEEGKSTQTCYFKCGTGPAALEHLRPIRNAKFQVPPQTYWVSLWILTRSTAWFLHTLKLEKF